MQPTTKAPLRSAFSLVPARRVGTRKLRAAECSCPMSRSRYRIVEPQAPHFMTFTVLEWLPVFTRPDTVQILLEAFTYRQQNRGGRWYGYVSLENHLHCIHSSSRRISTFPPSAWEREKKAIT